MNHPGTSQTSGPNPFDLAENVGLGACLGYGALVGLIFGVAMGAILAIPRTSYFPDDVLMRCFARGIFGGAELGIVFGLIVGGLIGGFGRRSLRFEASGATGGGIIGLLTGGVVAALLLMELRTFETSWRERTPYTESATTTGAVYALLSAAGATSGALFGYLVGGVIRRRKAFLRNVPVGILLLVAGGGLCGLIVNLAMLILKQVDPTIASCHKVL
jgi:hypothetical protein